MKYKQIYSETRLLKTPRTYEVGCVDAYSPDYLTEDGVPEGMPSMIRLCRQVNDELIDINWTPLFGNRNEAQVIREAIRLFDEAYPVKKK